jgi:SAM-dependent methyltransferase
MNAVEKTRISFYRKMPGVFFLLFLLFSLGTKAQKMQMIKGYCGIYNRSMDDLYRQKQVELDFYQFRPGQQVASIGAQCSHWEAMYAAASDSIDFYLQDIDTSFFNPRQTAFAWHYYDSLRGKPMTSTYQMVLGTEHSTGLPEQFFDKIMIINSFHEFTDQAGMLADLRRKLKKDGILYIDEAVPRKSGQKHGVCKLPMLMPEEMIQLLQKNGFTLTGSIDIEFRVNKTYRKIYAFRPGSL